MPKGLDSYNPYKYERDDTRGRLTYVFETDKGIKYQVYFTKCNGDFLYEHLDNQTYTFGFGPTAGQQELLKSNNPMKKTPPFDGRIMDTVVNVLYSVIKEDKDIALLFICSDDLDIKPEVRSRLFDQWLKKRSPVDMFGIDISKWDIVLLAESESENDEYLSLIARKDNKYHDDYSKEYLLRADDAEKVNIKRDSHT